MSYINNPDITKEDILKKSLAKERAIISGIWMAESS